MRTGRVEDCFDVDSADERTSVLVSDDQSYRSHAAENSINVPTARCFLTPSKARGQLAGQLEARVKLETGRAGLRPVRKSTGTRGVSGRIPQTPLYASNRHRRVLDQGPISGLTRRHVSVSECPAPDL